MSSSILQQIEYRDLAKQCKQFASDLLDMCQTTDEVQTILTQEATTEIESQAAEGANTLRKRVKLNQQLSIIKKADTDFGLPRLELAIIYRQKQVWFFANKNRVRSSHHQGSSICSPLRLRSCLFCEGRISVLKRWFKTPIQNALHGSTVHASLEKKTISWACTAHCSRLLFELKWTGKAFIWRHLNVVICDFAFMLPPESAFCSNHDRKRTFLGVSNQRFETTFIRK